MGDSRTQWHSAHPRRKLRVFLSLTAEPVPRIALPLQALLRSWRPRCGSCRLAFRRWLAHSQPRARPQRFQKASPPSVRVCDGRQRRAGDRWPISRKLGSCTRTAPTSHRNTRDGQWWIDEPSGGGVYVAKSDSDLPPTEGAVHASKCKKNVRDLTPV